MNVITTDYSLQNVVTNNGNDNQHIIIYLIISNRKLLIITQFPQTIADLSSLVHTTIILTHIGPKRQTSVKFQPT